MRPRPANHDDLAANHDDLAAANHDDKAWGEPGAHARGQAGSKPRKGGQKKKGCWHTIRRCFWGRPAEPGDGLEEGGYTPSLVSLPDQQGASRAIEQFVPLPNARSGVLAREGFPSQHAPLNGEGGWPQQARQEGVDASMGSTDMSSIPPPMATASPPGNSTASPPGNASAQARSPSTPAGGIEIDTIPTAMIFRPMPASRRPIMSSQGAPAPPPSADYDVGSETARGRRHMEELERVRALLGQREAQLKKEQAVDQRPLSDHTLPGFPRMHEGFNPPQRPVVPTLPISKTPNITPQQTPRDLDEMEEIDPNKDSTKVVGKGGKPVNCAFVERLVLQNIDAVQDCMLVSHWTSTEVGCLLSLKSAPGSAGLALDHSGLALASKSGSEASTVMSARQCAMFRKGLSLAIERVNHQITGRTVQIRRFQILRETFSQGNGLLNAQGGVERRMVLHRYRHIIDDMYQYEQRYPHKWMDPSSGTGENVTTQKEMQKLGDDPRKDLAHASHAQMDKAATAEKLLMSRMGVANVDRSVLDASISPPKLTGLSSKHSTVPRPAALGLRAGMGRPTMSPNLPSKAPTPQKSPSSPSLNRSPNTESKPASPRQSLLDQWSPEKILAQWSPAKMIPPPCSPNKSVPAPQEEAPMAWLPLGFAGEWLSALGEIGNLAGFGPEGSKRGDDDGTKSTEGFPQHISAGHDEGSYASSLARAPESESGSRQGLNQSSVTSTDGFTPRNASIEQWHGTPRLDSGKSGKHSSSTMYRGGRNRCKQRLPPAALLASFKGDAETGVQNRGAYAPAFASGAVRPYTKEAVTAVGTGGGTTKIVSASGPNKQGKVRDGRKRGHGTPKTQSKAMAQRPPLILEQTPTGEWAF